MNVRNDVDPRTAVVVGTGRMAPGIAAALALAGLRVTVVGRDIDKAASAASEARGLAARHVESDSFTPFPFERVGIVVETIVEDANIKRALTATLEEWVPAQTLIASNTSSLRIDELAAGLQHPQRFLGLHFLYPAHATAVVEVVPGTVTAGHVVTTAAQLVTSMGKRPLVLHADIEGFVWNRLQFALLREALYLVGVGIADAETVDAAVTHGLAPRWLGAGPLGTVDIGGWDVFYRAAENIFPTLASGCTGLEQLHPNRVDEKRSGLRDWSPARLDEMAAARERWLAVWRSVMAQGLGEDA